MNLKALLLFTFVCYNVSQSKAQQNEPILASIDYKFTHLQDTAKKDVIYKENMKLLLGKRSSLFLSSDKSEQSKNIKKQEEAQTKEAAGGITNFKFTGLRKINNTEIFLFFKDDKMITKEYLFRNYLYEEPVEKIDWKLSKDTLTIGGLSCQKATALFKGRNWIVWFTNSLPFEAGPWKLNGLPGLIIVAHDEKKEIEFSFNGFKTFDKKQQNNTITLPKDKMTMAKKAEIEKLRKAMYDNPRGFLMTQLHSTGGLVDDNESMQGQSSKKINNPIELPE